MQRMNIEETYNALRDSISNSSYMIAKGASDAADVAQKTADLNKKILEDTTNQALKYLDVFAIAGSQSTRTLSDILGVNGPQVQAQAVNNYIKQGSFQTELKAGADLVERSAAAKGLMNSGRALSELMDYSGQFTERYMTRIQSGLLGLSQQGLAAAQSQAGIKQTLGVNLAGQNTYAGDAKANAIMVGANARANAEIQRANLAAQWIGPMGSVPAMMQLLGGIPGASGGQAAGGGGLMDVGYYGRVNAQRQAESQAMNNSWGYGGSSWAPSQAENARQAAASSSNPMSGLF